MKRRGRETVQFSRHPVFSNAKVGQAKKTCKTQRSAHQDFLEKKFPFFPVLGYESEMDFFVYNILVKNTEVRLVFSSYTVTCFVLLFSCLSIKNQISRSNLKLALFIFSTF